MNDTTTTVVTAAPGVTKKRPVKKSAPKKAVKNAKKKAVKVAKKAAEPQICYCGCGGKTSGGKFLPGHDARFHGRVIKLSDGRLTMADLTDELGAKGAYALSHYKEGLKHAPKRDPHPSTVRKTAKEKATKAASKNGTAKKAPKRSKAKENTSSAKGDTSGKSPTAKYRALKAIDRAGEMNTIEVSQELGVGYSSKNMLKELVKDGFLTVENYPKENSDNKESADYFKITEAGREHYKAMEPTESAA